MWSGLVNEFVNKVVVLERLSLTYVVAMPWAWHESGHTHTHTHTLRDARERLTCMKVRICVNVLHVSIHR
jgi:hypothetical protein